MKPSSTPPATTVPTSARDARARRHRRAIGSSHASALQPGALELSASRWWRRWPREGLSNPPIRRRRHPTAAPALCSYIGPACTGGAAASLLAGQQARPQTGRREFKVEVLQERARHQRRRHCARVADVLVLAPTVALHQSREARSPKSPKRDVVVMPFGFGPQASRFGLAVLTAHRTQNVRSPSVSATTRLARFRRRSG